MKTLKIVIIALLTILAIQLNAQDNKKVLDIYYAHSTNRCPTCRAIEAETKATLDEQFKDELANGVIELHIINIDLKSSKEIVKKYKIWGSSLFIVKQGTDNTIDPTKEAFATARTKPDEFHQLLEKSIRELL